MEKLAARVPSEKATEPERLSNDERLCLCNDKFFISLVFGAKWLLLLKAIKTIENEVCGWKLKILNEEKKEINELNVLARYSLSPRRCTLCLLNNTMCTFEFSLLKDCSYFVDKSMKKER